MANKQDIKKTKKKINDFLNDMDWLFSAHNFERTVNYMGKDDGNTAADIDVNMKYNRIVLSIYPLFFDHDSEQQADFLLHEMVHIPITPLQLVADNLLNGKLVTERERTDHLERTTSTITYILSSLLQGKSKYASRAFQNYINPKKRSQPKKKKK